MEKKCIEEVCTCHSTSNNCRKKLNILIIVATENSLAVGRVQISLNVSGESVLLSKCTYLYLATKKKQKALVGSLEFE